jgi:uncharacterized protein (TIGR02594 family)
MSTNYRSLVPGGFYSSDPFDRSVHVSIRCNNPGAINGASWEETYPGYVETVETTPGNKTTIFEAPEYGVAVWWELLRRYATAGAKTVEDIINKYGGGQDYSNYISFVTRKTGFGENTKISLDDDETLLPFGQAMFRYEAGTVIPWKDDQIRYGLQLGRAGGNEDAVKKPAKKRAARSRGSKPSASKLVVTADNLNVRKTASLEGEVKGILAKNDVVQWLGSSGDDYWRKIKKGRLTGWASHKYLVPQVRNAPPSANRPWFPIAYGELGEKEIAGAAANPRIVEYLHSTNIGAAYDNTDETAWCSAFVNWCVEKAGHAGTDSASALSWGSWGTNATAPVPGDIVVFNWGGGNGHVGFFVSSTKDIVKVLGGNQGNEVCIKDWNRDKVYRIRKPA